MDAIERILNAKTIPGLSRAVQNFWYEYGERYGDDILLILQDELKNKNDSSIHRWLYSYLPQCENGDEFMDALIDFQVDCEAFHNINKEDTVQITETEFINVVEGFGDACKIKKLLTKVYDLNVIETDKGVASQETCFLIIGRTLNIFLPRVPAETHKEKYIGETIGLLLYEIETHRYGAFRMRKNLGLNSKKLKKSELTTQELYKILFYDVFFERDYMKKIGLTKTEIAEVENHLRVVVANHVFSYERGYKC